MCIKEGARRGKEENDEDERQEGIGRCGVDGGSFICLRVFRFIRRSGRGWAECRRGHQKSLDSGYLAMAENANDVLFGSGKIAMLPLGSWMVAPMKDNEYITANCAVAVLPKDAKTKRRVSIYNGLGWAVSAKTANPEGAWQLVEWFGSKEGQTRQAELGVSMSAYEGVSDGWKNNTDIFDLQLYLDMREDVEFRPYSNLTVPWENKISEDLKEAWNGNVTMEEACANVARDMNEILAGE